MTQPEGISGLFHGIRLLATRTGFILERPESAQLRRPRSRSATAGLRRLCSLMGQVGTLFRVSTPWDACVLYVLVWHLMG